MGSIGNVVIPGNRQTKELTLTTALTAGRDHHQLCSPVFRSILFTIFGQIITDGWFGYICISLFFFLLISPR